MARIIVLLQTFFFGIGFSQNYTSYFTGNPLDANTNPAGGVCLMGGASEDDNAMKWFLEQANGGDILVLRASGSNGYNDYFYTDLGVIVNSVETIVCHNANASTETYIHQRIEQAEAIWFAGGDQWNYISYWRNTAIDSLINLGIATRKIVIVGTSAGMAILGEVYFTAENGTITSATALNNPYATTATISNQDFLDVPYMTSVITDTHYDNPDRRGRHVVFMAKAMQDLGYSPKGIACEEYVAVCVDTFGIAKVYGGYPTYDEQAYFISLNCDYNDVVVPPQNCVIGQPLDWSYNDVLMVYKVNGTATGSNWFNLNTWQNGTGGSWEHWSVDNGILTVTAAGEVDCSMGVKSSSAPNHAELLLYPNPAKGVITISNVSEASINQIFIYDVTGRKIETHLNLDAGMSFQLENLSPGAYLIVQASDNNMFTQRFVVN